MNNFCTNCGAEINENAVICVKCGVATGNNIIPTKKEKNPGKGMGIAGMILNILAAIDTFVAFAAFLALLMSGEYFYADEKLIFGLFFLSAPIILLAVGTPLSFISRNKIQNGINLTGILLGIISLSLCLLSLFILCIL